MWLGLVLDKRLVGAMASLLGDDVNFHSMRSCL